ncbi:MAG: SIMPL domain-containing protein [Chloroflexi bacterium]|nr:SIMPL domain-containing protein [Chloroflexota bacterium]MBU1748271.1 SIMPL domain-containing protein [Chloroflexota bacterium]
MNTMNNWRSVFRFLTSPLGVLALILAGALLLAGPLSLSPARAAGPASPAPADADRTGSLAVSGAAAIKVQPDIATIHVGVETFATTPSESKRLNSDLIRSIKARVAAAGVAEADVQTDHYVIYPKFRDYDEHNISGYDTYNSVVITVRDVSRFEDVLVGALEGGATYVFGVEFSVDPDRLLELRQRARDMAVTAALDKAGRLAQAAGVDVDYVTNLNEDVSAYYSYSGWGYGGYWGRNNAGQYQNVIQVEPGDDASMDASSISLGQVVVRAKVNMTVKTR